MNGRSDLTCRTARNWLQGPEGLAPPDAWALTRHLEYCPECREHQARDLVLDNLLRASVQAAVGDRSVWVEVLAQLERTSRPRRRRPRPLAHLRPHAIPLAAAVAVGVLLALFVPQIVLRQSGQTPRAIAWRAPDPSIGYPLTVDPANADHLLAGDHGHVYESRDAGNSWHGLAPLPAGNVIRAVAIDRADRSQYLVATKHSIFRSVDAGRHWARAVDSLPGAMNMFLKQGPQPGTFYVGPSVLWRSVDGGRQWRPAGPGYVFAPDGIQALTIAPDGTLVTGIWAGGVAISRDGGAHWQRRAQGLALNVMDVAAPTARDLWAGTDRGVYHSTNAGLTWHRSGLKKVTVTSLLVQPRFILAGGTHGLYRSSDGGKTWHPIQQGLPPRPYVADFRVNPARPLRVYASLNTDGIFRSEDGGQTWQAASGGMPLDVASNRDRPITFLRKGYLWVTNSQGEDPGLLTIDDAVRLAAVSPDGVSAAYVTGHGMEWRARVLSAGGGSLATTVAHGKGETPIGLRWSPTSARLAVITTRSIVVSDLRGKQLEWRIPHSEHFVDWSADGNSLLLWNEVGGRIEVRSVAGAQLGIRPGRFTGPPALAPDHRTLAFAHGGALWTGVWRSAGHMTPIPASCHVASWSDDSTLLLLACNGHVEIRGRDGALQHRIALPDSATWAPGSHNLLYFADGSLWRWSLHGEHRLVSDAATSMPQ